MPVGAARQMRRTQDLGIGTRPDRSDAPCVTDITGAVRVADACTGEVRPLQKPEDWEDVALFGTDVAPHGRWADCTSRRRDQPQARANIAFALRSNRWCMRII